MSDQPTQPARQRQSFGRARDITGQIFGRLTVLRRSANRGTRACWVCLCSCGKETVVRGNHLQDPNGTRSCGCLARETARDLLYKHGFSSWPEHAIWVTMHHRCECPTTPVYPDYGGRGIKVCERWKSFEAFLEDMGRRPAPELTLERRDNDRDYGPDNCYWATRTDQARNRRSNRSLTFQGRTLLIIEWSEELGICQGTIHSRLRAGWSVERALSTPVQTTR